MLKAPAHFIAFAAASLAMFSASLAYAQKVKTPPPPFRYDVFYLPKLPGADSSTAHRINNRGDVVGYSDNRPYAFYYATGEIVDLNALLHSFGPEYDLYEIETVEDINDHGHIAGVARFYRDTEGPTWIIDVFAYRMYPPSGANPNWVFETSEWLLGDEGLSVGIGVASMNDDGDVLVYAQPVINVSPQELGWYKMQIWESGSSRLVETNLGFSSPAPGQGLSNRDALGQIAFVDGGGDGGFPSEPTARYVYPTGSDPDAALPNEPDVWLIAEALGSFGGMGITHPMGINARGAVVGESPITTNRGRDTKWHAFYQSSGPSSIIDLGLLTGKESNAYSLNDKTTPDILGRAETSESLYFGIKVWAPFLYTGGKIYDLRTMVNADSSGTVPPLDGLAQINDLQMIVGARDFKSGSPSPARAFLLLRR